MLIACLKLFYFLRVQIALKLLLHKIRSPQEREALQAITVLEACVKNCGELFQSAVGKSSFIDEMLTQIREEVITLLLDGSSTLAQMDV